MSDSDPTCYGRIDRAIGRPHTDTLNRDEYDDTRVIKNKPIVDGQADHPVHFSLYGVLYRYKTILRSDADACTQASLPKPEYLSCCVLDQLCDCLLDLLVRQTWRERMSAEGTHRRP